MLLSLISLVVTIIITGYHHHHHYGIIVSGIPSFAFSTSYEMYLQRTLGILITIIFNVIIIIQGQTTKAPSTDSSITRCTAGKKTLLLAVMQYPPYMFFTNASDPGTEMEGVVLDYFISAIRRCYHECNIEFTVNIDRSFRFFYL